MARKPKKTGGRERPAKAPAKRRAPRAARARAGARAGAAAGVSIGGTPKSLRTVRIVAPTLEKLRDLERFKRLDVHRRAARREAGDRFVIPGVVTDAQARRLRSAGYKVEPVAAVARLEKARRKDVPPRNEGRFVRPGLMAAAAIRDAARQGYLTASDVDAALLRLRTAYPNLVELLTAPEPTHEGRLCHVVRLGANPAPGGRPGVYVTGSMHAREWGGSDICVAFATRLVEAYTAGRGLSLQGHAVAAQDVRRILEGLDVFVFPDVNPDGKVFSQTQRLMWRKNRNPNNRKPATIGVDNNRNFKFLWDSGIGSSDDMTEEVYRGEGPFSEPETRNVRHFFEAFPDIRYYVDIHSFGKLILFSWGDDDNQHADPQQNFRNPNFDGVRGELGSGYGEFIPPEDQSELRRLAEAMNAALASVRGNPYTVQQAVGLYPTSGASEDYAFSRHLEDPALPKVYSFCLEFGDEFVPPYAEMSNIIDEVTAALVELCRSVAP